MEDFRRKSTTTQIFDLHITFDQRENISRAISCAYHADEVSISRKSFGLAYYPLNLSAAFFCWLIACSYAQTNLRLIFTGTPL